MAAVDPIMASINGESLRITVMVVTSNGYQAAGQGWLRMVTQAGSLTVRWIFHHLKGTARAGRVIFKPARFDRQRITPVDDGDLVFEGLHGDPSRLHDH